VPGTYPRQRVLAERTGVSASLVDAEPAMTAMLAAALRALRVSDPGRWLRQPLGRPLTPVDLGRTVSARTAVLFCLGAPGAPGVPAHPDGVDATTMLTRLVFRDLLGLAARLRDLGVDGDGVIWLHGCHLIEAPALTDLIAAGPAAGLSVVAATSSTRAAGELAEHLNALIMHRVTDPVAAWRLAAVAAPRWPGARTVAPPTAAGSITQSIPLEPVDRAIDPADAGTLTPDDVTTLGDGEFLLAVARPRRLVRRALAVRAREPA
jgi:hypothetical protein